MPHKWVLSTINNKKSIYENVKCISNEYDVSFTAAAIKYVETSNLPIALIVWDIQSRCVKWFKKSRLFTEYINFDYIHEDSVTNSLLFSNNRYKKDHLKANIWCPNLSNIYLSEESIKMPSLNQIYTFIKLE